MKLEVGNKLKTVFAKTKLGFKKHSAEILIAGGVTGVVVSAVLACVATTKVGKHVNDAKEKIKVIHKKKESDSENYTKKELGRELTCVYLKTGAKIIGLYAPAIILGGLSLTSIIASNNILKKRAAALAAAYATVDKSFNDYRNRVIERFGSEVDKELRYDIHKDKVTETVTDENRKDKKVKKDVLKTGYDGVSDFARIFDGKNPNFMLDDDYNTFFLSQIQRYMNDKLIVQGYLYLNEVYRELGFEETKAGQVVGWIYDKENNKRGDNYVDFRATKLCTKDEGEEVEYGYLLDFNVDGDILTYAHKE